MDCNSTSAAAAAADQRLSTTSSICITESVTATHDFEVANFRLLDGMGVGKFVRSSAFTVGGYDWCITFFPDGVSKGCDNDGSIYLCYLDRVGGHARARFTLSLLDKDRTVQVKKSNLTEHTFSPSRYSRGSSRFLTKSEMQPLSDLKNSSFVIRCVLTVIEPPRTEVRKRRRIAVPPPDLQDHLRKMWRDGEGADVVTFSVSGELFHAHRCLLAARSPVFKAELFGPMKEKATQCITVDGIEPAIFEALLHFMYTDCVPNDDEDHSTAKLQHLLVAADRYGVERLKLICESKLCESIDAQTAATTLALAEQHHCSELREACVEFMASRDMLGAVMATDGFKHLVASCPSLVVELLEKLSQAD